jgi:DNA-binding MarR family transcriptional regulator
MHKAEAVTSDTTTAQQAAYALRVALGAFKRRVRETHGEGDLTSPQLTALSRLDRLGVMTTADLARREQISPQAMGATILSLEKLGLVARSEDPADARRQVLNLTSEGLEAIRSGRNAVADRIAVVLKESFTDEEMATLATAASLIERLAELL